MPVRADLKDGGMHIDVKVTTIACCRALEELSEAVPLREPRQSGEGSEEPTTIRASTSGRPSDSSAAAAPTVAVIIDSLSSLLFLHPEHKVI